MDISEALRRAYITAIGTLTVNGVNIPVFDEFVNPNTTIPVLKLTSNPNEVGPQVYVVIQDQQEVDGIQNFCSHRQNCSITIRIVTKFNSSVGGKRYSEAVADILNKKIKPTPRTHALIDGNGFYFQRVDKELSRSYSEFANNVTAVNKVIIYNNIVNQ